MRTYKTEGIILKRSNFGEADRLLTVFTKHYGKIRCRAPGIRRTISRKAPHLELFNLSTLFLVQGKNLDIVTEAQTINSFNGFRKDLPKVGIAYYLCELVDGLCPERQENREVFELLKKSLEILSCGGATLSKVAPLNNDFANQLLWNLGFLQKNRTLIGEELERFIENILERKLRSPRLLRKIGV